MKDNWSLLFYYPAVIPDDETINRWQQSEWSDYTKWIEHDSIMTRKQWIRQYKTARRAKGAIRISIVTPVYNTEPSILKECILSVRTQTSPFWEFILVDDCSSQKETLEVLASNICRDPRIRVIYAKDNTNSGISAATNRGIDIAQGDFIIFLDHDDRLAPEAIQMLICTLIEDPSLDIIYSDRDMLSSRGMRFMHLMKPDWSPENLYGGNYIFHLMCYRRDLIIKSGRLRSKYDGSQDYDLILRCMELTSKIKHLPYVLYHWRQHVDSVSLDSKAKNYAFDAGMAALRDALRRRGIPGSVNENKNLWRGNYQIKMDLPPRSEIGTIYLEKNLDAEKYSTLQENPVLQNPPPYIFIQWEGFYPEHSESIRILASWLNLNEVGIVSGCCLNETERILYAGMTYKENGEVLLPYCGFPKKEPGYMAVTKTARNISAPYPYSVMIRREVWQKLGGFNNKFKTPYALLDLALTALKMNWRIVYVPQSVFSQSAFYRNSSLTMQDVFAVEQELFYDKWKDWLTKGDPYYSVNLCRNSIKYDLA
jgi:glycosyltransferase involved in cell wall biosynthesis